MYIYHVYIYDYTWTWWVRQHQKKRQSEKKGTFQGDLENFVSCSACLVDLGQFHVYSDRLFLKKKYKHRLE